MRIVAIAIAVSGCVVARGDQLAPVAADVQRRVGVAVRFDDDARAGRIGAAIDALLAHPLDRDAVVRIALAASPRLQASLERLGVGAAAMAGATGLGATEVDLSLERRLGGDGDGGEGELEVDVVQDVLGLLQLGQRRGVADAERRAIRARATADAVDLVARAEIALYDVVAAGEERALRQAAFDAAGAAAELSARQRAAGNVSELELAQREAAREEARLDLGQAEAAVELRREALNAVLGLHGPRTRWTAVARLPALPDAPPPLDDLEAAAVAASLELVGRRAEAEAAAGRVGHARLRSVLPELGLGLAATRHEGGAWSAGPALRIGVPLFDWGGGPRARAHADLRVAEGLLAAGAVELRAAARAARQRVLAAHAEARHLRDVVLPLRARLIRQAVLQHNAMNLGTYELLAARQAQVESSRRYVDAVRRYLGAVAIAEALRRGGTISAADREAVAPVRAADGDGDGDGNGAHR